VEGFDLTVDFIEDFPKGKEGNGRLQNDWSGDKGKFKVEEVDEDFPVLKL